MFFQAVVITAWALFGRVPGAAVAEHLYIFHFIGRTIFRITISGLPLHLDAIFQTLA
jgi:hypothetical protein